MDLMEILKRIKENVLLIPSEKFDELTNDKGYMNSFLYLLVCLAISFPIKWLIGVITYPEPVMAFVQITTPLEIKIINTFIGVLIGAILVILLIYPFYLVQHAVLKLLGAKGGLLKSVQVLIYGGTCALLFGFIPFIGIIAYLITLSNVVLGLARVHQIAWWKAFIAVVIVPLVLYLALEITFRILLGSIIGPYGIMW